jgi:hypothetical protein
MEEEPCWEVRAVPGRGHGIFATRDIEPGTAILTERPLVTFTNLGAGEAITERFKEEVARRFKLLRLEEQTAVLALHCPEVAGEGAERVLAILKANGLEAWTGEDAVDLYQTFSRINHSCRPNTIQRLRADGEGRQVTMTAVRRVAAGEEILWCYSNAPFRSGQARRHALAFPCWCEACALEGPEREGDDRARREVRRLVAGLSRALDEGEELGVSEEERLRVSEVLQATGSALLELDWGAGRAADPRTVLYTAVQAAESLDCEEVGRRLRAVNTAD